MQYDSQESKNYCGSHTWEHGRRKVFTTRSDGEICFSSSRASASFRPGGVTAD